MINPQSIFIRLYIVVFSCLSTFQLLASPPTQSIDWETQEGVFELEEEGFTKETSTGWREGLAISSSIPLSTGLCLSLNISNMAEVDEIPFIIGLSNDAESEIGFTPVQLSFNGSQLVMGSSAHDYADLSDLSIEVSPAGQVSVKNNGTLLHTFLTGLAANTDVYIHLNLYEEGAFIPLIFGICTYVPEVEPIDLPCSNLSPRKYVEQEAYSKSGNLIAHSLQLSNNLGQPDMSLRKNIAEGEVLAKAFVQDKHGRLAIETLEAPIGESFCYDEGFFLSTDQEIRNQNGQSIHFYSWEDFDQQQEHPVPVSEESTLGAYYNGTQGSIAKSAFPFARQFYTNDLFQDAISSGAYTAYNFLAENRAYNFTGSAHNELDYVYGFNGTYSLDAAGQPIDGNNLYAIKSISIPKPNVAVISYANQKGQVLATALSGESSNVCITQKNKIELPDGVQTLIHVPATKTTGLVLDFPDPQSNFINAPASAYPVNAFDLRIYDLIHNKLMVPGTDYALANHSSDATKRHINLLGDYVNVQSVLGISVAPNALAEQAWWEFLQNLNLPLKTFIEYETDYGNWSISYYNLKDELVKTVQPEGIDCSVDASNGQVIKKRLYGFYKGNTGGELFSMPLNLDPTYTNSIDVCLKPNRLMTYNASGGSNYTIQASQTINKAGQGPEPADIDPPEIVFPGLEEMNNLGSFKNGIPNGADPYISGAPEPALPDDAEEVVYSYAYEFDVQIIGKQSGGYSTELKKWTFYIQTDEYFYLLPNDVGGVDIVGRRTKVIRKRDGVEVDWDNPHSWYRLNDWNASPQNFADYDELFITTNVEKRSSRPWISKSNSSINIFAQETSPPAWDNISTSPLSFLGNIGIQITSLPSMPNHRDELSTTYAYDDAGYLVEQDMPDQGKTQLLHNDKGQVKFSQNAVQALNNAFSYTLYDNWYRIVESGVYQNNGISTDITFGLLDPEDPALSHVYNLRNVNDPLTASQCSEQHFSLYDVSATDFPLTDPLFAQKNLAGRISKSWNDNASSWYSYDYLGRLTCLVRSTPELGVKTMRYTYNELDQVVSINIDELSSQPYFVEYTYDANQQLIKVEGSTNPSNGYVVLGQYTYDVHGRLERSELGDQLQGIDYYYTIEGNLKSINNAVNPQDDQDLITLNSTFADLFGETLHYYEGDYENENQSINSISNVSFGDNRDGLVKAASWYTNPDISLSNTLAARPTYAYSYDVKGQLTEAELGNISTGTTIGQGTAQYAAFTADAGSDYKVNFSYDLNGNIQSLKRRAYGASNLMDDLTYHYPENANQQLMSNQLTNVDDLVASSTYADELTDQAVANYTYDAMGRLVGDVQRDALIAYNSSGLVSEVRTLDGTKLREQNTYDESGLLIQKQRYNSSGNLHKKEYWVYNSSGRAIAYYEEDFSPASQGIALKNNYVYDAGRLATVDRTTTQESYAYELKDHIGNVRASFGTNTTTAYTTSFMRSQTNGWRCDSEEGCFSGDEGFEILESDLTFSVGTSLGAGRHTFTLNLNSAISAPLELQVKDAQGSVVASQIFTNTASLSMSFVSASAQVYTMALVVPVSGTDISLIVESAAVKQTQLQVLSYADYYPFGWEMPGRQYTAAGADQQHGYQGDYARKNPDLVWNSFKLRNFDSRLGRWLSVDPAAQYHSLYMAMGNNPISMFDPDGAWAEGDPKKGNWGIMLNAKGEVEGLAFFDGMFWNKVEALVLETVELIFEQTQASELLDDASQTSTLGTLPSYELAREKTNKENFLSLTTTPQGVALILNNPNMPEEYKAIALKNVMQNGPTAQMYKKFAATLAVEGASYFLFSGAAKAFAPKGLLSVEMRAVARTKLGPLGGNGLRALGKAGSKVDDVASVGKFDDLAKTGKIDPNQVRFSQNSISANFKDGTSVSDLTKGLKNGSISPNDIPAIRIVEKDGLTFTLDNRRLKAFQDAGLPINYQRLDLIPNNQKFKFTTTNQGTSIDVR
jgi:RHS repeat-associated protein